jgi:hypothetical protein
VVSYARSGNVLTNEEVEKICALGFAIDDKDYVIDDGSSE